MRFRLVLVGLEGAAGVFCQLPHVTSVSWPGLDFTGPTASVNVAAQAAGGVPFGSGSLQVACDRSGAGEGKDYGTGGHCLNNINDGLYGSSSSWIPGAPYNGSHFVGISFPGPVWIVGFRVSRNGLGIGNVDRIEGLNAFQYTVAANASYDTPEGDWCGLRSFVRSGAGFYSFEFGAVLATAVRIVTANSGACFDELSVYGGTATTTRTVTTVTTTTFVLDNEGIANGALSTSLVFGLSLASLALPICANKM